MPKQSAPSLSTQLIVHIGHLDRPLREQTAAASVGATPARREEQCDPHLLLFDLGDKVPVSCPLNPSSLKPAETSHIPAHLSSLMRSEATHFQLRTHLCLSLVPTAQNKKNKYEREKTPPQTEIACQATVGNRFGQRLWRPRHTRLLAVPEQIQGHVKTVFQDSLSSNRDTHRRALREHKFGKVPWFLPLPKPPAVPLSKVKSSWLLGFSPPRVLTRNTTTMLLSERCSVRDDLDQETFGSFG